MKTIKVVVTVICDSIKDKMQIWVRKRDCGEFKGQWDFSGGKIESVETPQEALARIIQEELDVKIEVYDEYSCLKILQFRRFGSRCPRCRKPTYFCLTAPCMYWWHLSSPCCASGAGATNDMRVKSAKQNLVSAKAVLFHRTGGIPLGILG